VQKYKLNLVFFWGFVDNLALFFVSQAEDFNFSLKYSYKSLKFIKIAIFQFKKCY